MKLVLPFNLFATVPLEPPQAEPDRRPCVGDGLGEPSTCQIHMAAWFRAQQQCETARAQQERNPA